MKLIVELNNLYSLVPLLKHDSVYAIIVSHEFLSFTPSNAFTKEEIGSIKKKVCKYGKKLCINAERIFCDKELDEVQELINSHFFDLFDYIFYSDLGLFELLVNNGYQDLLIFRSPTILTNSQDLRLYNEMNHFVVASSKISKEELIKLDSLVDFPYILDLFGMNSIFYSRRKLLSTYFDYRGLSLNPHDKYLIKEELRDSFHEIREDNGTVIFEEKFAIIDFELDHLVNASYGIIKSLNLSTPSLLKVVEAYEDFFKNKDLSKLQENLHNNIFNVYKGAYDIKSTLLKERSN